MNTFFNPKDKRQSKRQILEKYCEDAVMKQKHNERYFRSKPNEILIHSSDGAYKVVSKSYALYHMEEDEYETETELEDEEWVNEVERIKAFYNK
jgi:ADP-glucose pyrophosphorylase